jgi:hypothetical protein
VSASGRIRTELATYNYYVSHRAKRFNETFDLCLSLLKIVLLNRVVIGKEISEAIISFCRIASSIFRLNKHENRASREMCRKCPNEHQDTLSDEGTGT